MKGAGARVKTPRSRLTKLHALILRANLLLREASQSIWRSICWLWQVSYWPRQVVQWLFKAILQVGSFVGVAYLFWASLSQTTVALSVVYSDALTGLENPIAIQNRSDLFSIKNIRWRCRILEAKYERNNELKDIHVSLGGNIDVIPPGRALNISCQKEGGFQAVKIEGAKLLSARIIVDVAYDADFFGWWQYPRTISVPFTWIGEIAQPQWVQWDFAR